MSREIYVIEWYQAPKGKKPKIRAKWFFFTSKLFPLILNHQWLMVELQHRFIFQLVFNQCFGISLDACGILSNASLHAVRVVIALSYNFCCFFEQEMKLKSKDLSRCQINFDSEPLLNTVETGKWCKNFLFLRYHCQWCKPSFLSRYFFHSEFFMEKSFIMFHRFHAETMILMKFVFPFCHRIDLMIFGKKRKWDCQCLLA